MIAEPTEGVSEGGNRGKVVKKRKIRHFSEISTALMGMKERGICQSDNTFVPPAQKVDITKVSSDLQISRKKNCLVLEDGFKTRFLATLLPAKKTLLPWNFDLFLILRFSYSEGGRIQRSFLDLGTF